MLVDQNGQVVYKKNGLIDTEQKTIERLLNQILQSKSNLKTVSLNGISYMPATLERSGETTKELLRERFSSLACALDGRVYVVFTTNRNGNSDVFIRMFDGKAWSEDKPIAVTDADEYDGAIAIDKQNRVWVSWTSNADGKNYNIFVTSFNNVSQPLKPVQVTQADDDAMHARIACDRNDNIYLTYYKWHRIRQWSRDKEIYIRQCKNGKWSDEVQVSPTDVSQYEDHSDPSITSFGDSAIVCWSWDFHRPKGYTRKASEPSIFIRLIGNNLKLGKITAVSGFHIDMTPTIAVDGDGNIRCAWDSLGRKGKTLCVKVMHITGKTVQKDIQILSGPVINICSPTLAKSPTGQITLIWCETKDGNNWVLKRASLNTSSNRWSLTETVESKGNPRFCSSAYDRTGKLWISYSVETDQGREISIRNLE